MLKKIFLSVFVCSGVIFQLQAQNTMIIRKEAAINQIIPDHAVVEKVRGGFQFVEGPVWHKEGYLLFSDIPASTIYKLDQAGKLSVLRRPSNQSNGLTLDHEGNLLSCEHGSRSLGILNKEGQYHCLVDQFDGKRFNSPNDLVIKSDGTIYFTDPAWGLPKKNFDPAKEYPYQGVFRYKNGKAQLLIYSLQGPNGIAFSPNEQYLYIADLENNDTSHVRKQWYRLPVKKDGRLGRPQLFFEIPLSAGEGNPDGMKIDIDGNLYLTGGNGIWVVSPKGKLLGMIQIPEIPANCAWGDEDRKTLYITARTSIYKIRLNIKGVCPQ